MAGIFRTNHSFLNGRGIMKKLVWLLAIAFITLGASEAQTVNKYDIKSGVVTLEIETKVSTMEIKMTKIVYFDDYGKKQCEETYSDGKLSSVVFSDGKDKISLSPGKKTARKEEGAGEQGIGPRVEINFFGTTKDVESGVVKKMPSMTLAGQTCEVFQITRGSNTQTYAGWNKVMVYTKTEGTEIKAVKIEPNATVPKEKFQVPAGYTMK
jgi:hypothetical protein